jgi:hypothetical protein
MMMFIENDKVRNKWTFWEIFFNHKMKFLCQIFSIMSRQTLLFIENGELPNDTTVCKSSQWEQIIRSREWNFMSNIYTYESSNAV